MPGRRLFELLLIPNPKSIADLQGLARSLLLQDFTGGGVIFRHVHTLTVQTPEDLPWALDGSSIRRRPGGDPQPPPPPDLSDLTRVPLGFHPRPRRGAAPVPARFFEKSGQKLLFAKHTLRSVSSRCRSGGRWPMSSPAGLHSLYVAIFNFYFAIYS